MKDTLKQKILAMSEATPLEKEVLLESLRSGDSDDEIKSFFKDLAAHGCVSGMVDFLIFYHDTLAFFKKHCEEILELWDDMEEERIEPMTYPSYNWFAWFGFEEAARKVAEKLGIEE